MAEEVSVAAVDEEVAPVVVASVVELADFAVDAVASAAVATAVDEEARRSPSPPTKSSYNVPRTSKRAHTY